jgi:hypothetical protein
MDEATRKGRRDPEKEKFWRVTMGEAEQSGKTVRQFCAEKGLKENQFYAWRRELKLRDAEARHGTGFVELVTGAKEGGTGGIRIRLGNGLSIEMERGFDGETLKAALAIAGEVGR